MHSNKIKKRDYSPFFNLVISKDTSNNYFVSALKWSLGIASPCFLKSNLVLLLQVQPPYTFTLSVLVVASVSLSIPVAAVTTQETFLIYAS